MSNLSLRPAPASDWLVGGGEMGERIRAHDWARTPLGPVESWPQSLRSAVSILLPSRAQICLFWGPELVAIYNDAYRPALGVKHPRALGLPAREVWSEFWADVLRPLLEGVLTTGQALWASDYPFFLERHGYPEETYFDISYDPVRDETGAVGGIFCIVSETTGRVLGERRLRMLRDLGRISSDARSVREVFQRAAAVLEANSHDIAFALLFDADAQPITAVRVDSQGGWPLGASLAGGELVLSEQQLRGFGRLSGGPWPEAARAAMVLPILVPGQPCQGYLVAGVSPRRELDDAYRDFLRLAASSIAAGLAAARALEEQRSRAEALAEIDRAKTAFFSNVSHEFRTPLTLMLGPLQELQAGAAAQLPAQDRERLDTAYRNSVRLHKLVNTLLEFSRIEAGRADARFEPTELASFTEELASNFRSACEKAGLRLALACEPPGEPVYVDRGMWEKIVLNLLSNAFKFTFEGEIRVSLARADERIELKVEDTGIGIAPHEMPRLFERFHRVEGAKARTHEGSGIGLALVQELVRLHAGEIRAASEPGRGSVFTVSLPLGSRHLPQDRLAARAAPVSPSASAAPYVSEALDWLRGSEPVDASAAASHDTATRILVVDDNADMRAYVARLLGAHWSVASAANGKEALDALGDGRFDLVISDVMMPQLDGFDLLRAIKSDPAKAEIPVIVLSARAGEEARFEGIGAGADDYLVKPFTAGELIVKVKSQLMVTRLRREAARERERLLASEHAAKREAELQREHLVSLFMQAPNPIVILRGPQHVVDLANLPACRIWGREHAEVIGRPLREVLPELQGQGFEELLDGVLATGVPYQGKEMPAQFDRRGAGRLDTLYFNFVYSPLRNVAGTIEGILVIAFDVTDEIRARQQMDGLRADAESASRTKDEFLAMLSHELRNPLAPMVTALQVMRLRGQKSAELEILERQAAHLTRLVDDLLDVSRITRGKIELRKRPMEIAEAVVRAMEIAGPLLEQRSHQIDMREVATRGLPVEADPERLAQVVSNLLTNAAKYSDPGSRITVRARRDGRRVLLSIRDEGVGIAPQMAERIFELFVQQPQTLARSEGGLGLGLAIVRNLVAMHGGTVKVRSPGLGQGSEFVVELPALDGAALPQDAAPRPGAQGRAAPRRILVVDDNRDAATTLGFALREFGHAVEIAHDGTSALQLAGEFDPEIALVDIGLPRMDGFELAQRLRQARPSPRPIYMVAVTGYGLEGDRQRAFEAGFQRHLVKPVDIAQLQRLITELQR